MFPFVFRHFGQAGFVADALVLALFSCVVGIELCDSGLGVV